RCRLSLPTRRSSDLIWQIGRNGCSWPGSEDGLLYRDFALDDVVPVATDLGIAGTVLVQTQADDRDTDFLLQIAEQNEFVCAVIGWADLAADGAVARITQLARHQKLRGLRPMLQALAE